MRRSRPRFLIDCEKDRTLRAVLGMLQDPGWAFLDSGRIGVPAARRACCIEGKGEAMFVTMVDGRVEDAREGDLRSAWDERTSGNLPTGLVESYLMMHANDGMWRIVTLWESNEVVMAMRSTVEKPTAI